MLRAFQILDTDGVGYLTKRYLSEKMIKQGEHFTQEELKEMLSVAVNSEEDDILYEVYLNHIMVNEFLKIIHLFYDFIVQKSSY